MPALVPLLRDMWRGLDPALRAELGLSDDQVDATDEAALRRTLFPVTGEYAYLNHAAIGPSSAPVEAAMRRALRAHSFGGSLATEATQPVAQAREGFARLINGSRAGVAFTKNVSDAFMTVAAGLDWRPGDNIVTAACEFPANVYPWLNLAEQGVETRFAPVVDGRVPLDELAARIDSHTRLVSISYVEFSTGYRNDVAAIARLAHAAGALCAVDAIQALGALRLDVAATGVDFVAAGSVKWLMAPAHVGILYVRPELLPSLRTARRGWRSVEEPFDFFNYAQPLRSDAGRLEGGSQNWLALTGLDAALRLLQSTDMAQIEARVLALARLVADGLRERGHMVTSPDGPGERSGIVLFRPRDARPVSDVPARLAANARVVVSARDGQVRVSPHFYTTEEDIQRFIAALESAPDA